MTAHYVMVGGFLGAGKTTALLRAAEHLVRGGRRVGLIVNDQSGGLVDSALVRSRHLPVEEIAGGCFCCRFSSLVEAAERLDASTRPDVLLAEPVGSCTDLAATVALPLRHIYGDRYHVAPLSVLVDPERASRVLGLSSGGSFSSKVTYVYRKQLEEADVLVINKIDAAPPDRVAVLGAAFADLYPSARIVQMSARTGEGVAEWITPLLEEGASGRVLDIDYDTYADGEALLGWLNCIVDVRGGIFDGDTLLQGLASRVHRDLAADGLEVAHLKLTLTPTDGGGISVVNAVRTDAPPELAFPIDALLESGEITLNLRAEAPPERLELAVRQALADEGRACAAGLVVRQLERFRPGRPVPTHRMGAGG